MSKYSISEKALEDINTIWNYTAENWSTQQANRYYNLILDEIEFVAANFETAKDFETIRKDYRYSKVKSHLVFFKKTKNNEIEVVRVLHERMDIKNKLIE
ncbi:type II toxin-antitoxin system RelE/ParE family toxin [Flavobacterium sp.]|jgi:toxin ParE1/3/4|uniref:type II toxin-antitoxin system RelE/ParE family toxin n=1 Tax=Flavobacterium sp. TaxID=239 RepID=UPI0037BFC373